MSRIAWTLVVLGLAVLLGLMGWAVYASRVLGSWTGGSRVILLMIVLGTGGLAGVLMWLAFYSERRAYDDRAGSGDDAE